ncbi:hypothetical protein DV737_g3884, partial [Chaetothyriales sp. CBS 132003]
MLPLCPAPVAKDDESKPVVFQSFNANDELEGTVHLETRSRVALTGMQHGMRVVVNSKHAQVTTRWSHIPAPFFDNYPSFKQKVDPLPQAVSDRSSAANACQGAAAATHRTFHDMYEHLGNDVDIAGLWRTSLLSDLLWRVSKARGRIRGTTPDVVYEKTALQAVAYRASPWSRASVDDEHRWTPS